MDISALMSQFMDSKISNLMLKGMANDQRVSRALPSSARRSFDGQMESDARMLMQSSRNMKDAMTMVSVAQTGVTAMKAQLTEINRIATDLANNDSLSEEDFKNFSRVMQERAEEIIRLAEGQSFNGMSLHNGTAGLDSDGTVVLQGGGEPMDQDLFNLVDGDITGVLGANGNVNFNNLGAELDITDKEGAKALVESLGTYIDRLGSMEGTYSNDYKSLENLSVMFEDRANIFANTIQYKDNPENEEKVSSASYLDQLMQGGGNGSIFSAKS